ncbi:MAG TPA: GDSL-type esterase/lipase family protein [Acidimicrobiales bacterium]|nr:GDSL-type esterase/lipase family protein [Acidimicrobiales bacterium]
MGGTRRRTKAKVLTITAGLVAAAALSTGPTGAPAGAVPASPAHWVASWTASPTDSFVPTDAAGLPVPQVLAHESLRMIVTPHLGGTTLRVHLSNRFGRRPAVFGHVTVGLADSHAVSSVTTVTFGGSTRVIVAVGADAVSDPVALPFSAFDPLAVSIYVPGVQILPTKHWNANATSRWAPPGSGDLTAVTSDNRFSLRTEAWLYVDGVDVLAPSPTASIVAFGDSITDGYVAATPLSQPVSLAIADKNGRYPDDLQRRLAAADVPLSVVNAGIGSNRLVTDGEPLMMGLSGLQRFEQDALDVAGVKGVLLVEGINDLGLPPATTTAADLIAGYEQAITMAHAKGLKIWLGTLSPASNAVFDGTITAPKSEISRQQVNAWIRSQALADGVVDFDAVLRDPHDPHVLDPRYAGPDHLHPNLAGYQAMADAVPLAMLESAL